VRLALFYAASFAVLGVFMPYFPVWLEGRGCTEAQIGWVLSAGIWMRSLAGPVWAQWVDRSGRRRTAIIALAWGSLAGFLTFGMAWSIPALVLCSMAFSLCYPPLHPLLDNLTVVIGEQRGFAYGRVRAVGSLSFLLVASGVGVLLEDHPPALVFWLLAGALLATGITGFVLPAAGHAPSPVRRRPLRELLGERTFLVFLVAIGAIQSSHAAYYGFGTLHWQRAGIAESVIGALWAEGVIAEVLLFLFVVGRFAAIPPLRLVLIGAAGAAVRWLVTANTTSLPALAAVQWLHALSFGCTHLGAVPALRLRGNVEIKRQKFQMLQMKDNCSFPFSSKQYPYLVDSL
jgi:PPP family 3-phenylpropionic acid transporter